MEEQERLRIHPRVLVMVTRVEDEKKLARVLDFLHIPIAFQCRGKGTAPSELMDILGFRGTTRLVTIAFRPRFLVHSLFDELERRLSFSRRGGGIAFTVPIIGMQGHMMQMLNEEARDMIEKRIEGAEEKMKETSGYSVIWVATENGFSDEVVDAARAAGARGGTVIKGRRKNSEKASLYFGVPIQEEQEFVMILVEKEKRTRVMTAISDACGLRTPAHGIVFSLPVDEVIGLER